MRFFRGISVSSSVATETVEYIERRGLDASMGIWRMTYSHPGIIDELFSKDDLSCEDTRARQEEECPAVCACGELGGPIEDALFVLLLTFLKAPDDTPWKPFLVPWIYSFTDDQFADVSRSPDPSVLTRTLVGDPDDQFEIPDQSESFDITNQDREEVCQRWSNFQETSNVTNPKLANFHPLTRHFFVKALIEDGIDEIVAAISCIEATLQLPNERSRTKLMKRYTHLVNDAKAAEWLNRAYKLRNDYLHSLANYTATVTWNDLAQTRWCVARAVNEYLSLASQHSELNRQDLLEQLDQ